MIIVMVQLGVESGKKGLMQKLRAIFQEKQKSWDMDLVRHNREQMVRIFVSAIQEYNLGVTNRETIDRNGVHIAEQLISPEGYRLVMGYHSDIVTDDSEIVEYGEVYKRRIQTTVYTNLLIGYNWQTMTIVIVQVNADLTAFSKIYAFSKRDILRAKYSWFSDVFQIYDRSESVVRNMLTFLSSKNRTTFVVNAESSEELIDEDGRLILVYMRQNEEREDFLKFFKKFAKIEKEWK